jgi:GTPase SAR1 family protein
LHHCTTGVSLADLCRNFDTNLDAQGIIIVYDVTNRRSFEALETWLSDVKERADKNVVIAIAGNKMDLKYE